VANRARNARTRGNAKPPAGAISHRQQANRIAINTGVSRFDPPASISSRTGIPYQCFNSAGLTVGSAAIASIWLAICAQKAAVASTFQRG
jgi:hypothetical protein